MLGVVAVAVLAIWAWQTHGVAARAESIARHLSFPGEPDGLWAKGGSDREAGVYARVYASYAGEQHGAALLAGLEAGLLEAGWQIREALRPVDGNDDQGLEELWALSATRRLDQLTCYAGPAGTALTNVPLDAGTPVIQCYLRRGG